MKKLRSLKLRKYEARLIGLNDYLASFTGTTLSDKFGGPELSIVLLNSMPNICSKQVYVQGFDCKSISFKNQLTCLNEWIFLDLFMNLSIKTY